MGFVFEREMKFPVELIKSFFSFFFSFFLLNCSKYLDIQFNSVRAAVFFPDLIFLSLFFLKRNRGNFFSKYWGLVYNRSFYSGIVFNEKQVKNKLK